MADIFTGRLREEIPAALEALLPALQTCASLHTVNLCDNAFGPTAAEPLEKFFTEHTPLRHLFLQNNGMGPEAGARMARALAKNPATLETIICGRNRLENGSASAWVECFNAHKTLKVVKMPQNGIRPEGMETIMRDGLGSCPDLEVVDMQDNTFTQKGSAALASVLPRWSSLTELAVGDCLLGARGGLVIAEALQKGSNKTLLTVRLQYNDIDAEGLKAFAVAADIGLPALNLIELNGNKFAEDDDSLDTLRTLFEDRGNGSIDDLDDLEEPSDDEDSGNEDDEDNAAQNSDDAASTKPELSALDAAIEKNLAEAMGSASLTS